MRLSLTRDGERAFTLIELLIVIAIIAILALIAIPNFLEAQTRSKVSRAHSDMRSLETALQAYMVDRSTLPPSICPYSGGTVIFDCFNNNTRQLPNGGCDFSGGVNPECTWVWYGKLTTPISYITSIPLDPFSKGISSKPVYGGDMSPYGIYTGNTSQYAGTQRYRDSARSTLLLNSIGPNKRCDTRLDHTHYDSYMVYDKSWVINRGGEGGMGLFYDPTNGTMSDGDVVRFTRAGGDYPSYGACAQTW